MASEKLVRCRVSKRNGSAAGHPTSRYIPLDIFQLWEFLMRERHSFDVSSPVTSLWFERGETSESTYSGLDIEPVTRVELFFFAEEDGMLHQKVRFFPSREKEEYFSIRDTFLSHYREIHPDARKSLNFRENPGVWICR